MKSRTKSRKFDNEGYIKFRKIYKNEIDIKAIWIELSYMVVVLLEESAILEEFKKLLKRIKVSVVYKDFFPLKNSDLFFKLRLTESFYKEMKLIKQYSRLE